MTRGLPRFLPGTLDELRSIWVQLSYPDGQRLALEVVRYRDVTADIDQLYKVIHQA